MNLYVILILGIVALDVIVVSIDLLCSLKKYNISKHKED